MNLSCLLTEWRSRYQSRRQKNGSRWIPPATSTLTKTSHWWAPWDRPVGQERVPITRRNQRIEPIALEKECGLCICSVGVYPVGVAGFLVQRSVPGVLAGPTSLVTCLKAETLVSSQKFLSLLFFWFPIPLVNMSRSLTSYLQAIIHNSLRTQGCHR